MKLYAVSMLCKKEIIRIKTINQPIEQEIDLSWAEGMIGAMPIFDDYDKALSYINGHKYSIIELEL